MGLLAIMLAVKDRMAALQGDSGPRVTSAWLGEVMAVPLDQYPAARVIQEVQSDEDYSTGYRRDLFNLTVWADLVWEDSEENCQAIVELTEAIRDELRANPELGGVASEVKIGESHYVLTSRGGDTFRTSITQVQYKHEVPD